MKQYQVKITGTPPDCTVELDGEPVIAMAVDIHLNARSLPAVTIQPHVLVALGWTPPAEDGPEPSPPEVDL